MVKSPKGGVSVSIADGRLRLRWQGRDAQNRPKRFSLAFGAANNVNRMAAERLAKTIELDIASGNFDPTLRKYKASTDQEDSDLSISELFERFVREKFQSTQNASIERYQSLKRNLIKTFGDVGVDSITEKSAQKFHEYLIGKGLGGETINMYLTVIRAVWEWGIKKRLLQANPWLDLSVSVEPKQQPKPFTREEITLILQGFEGSFYLEFVCFLLGTGCRIGEVAALSWDVVSDDCSEVLICKAWDNKGRRIKSTKTNQQRVIPVSPKIQELLQQRRLARSTNVDLVFPSPSGAVIDRGNFLKRYWKPILEKLGIPYRSTYNSRHTRWSHEIANGMDVAIAARYAGNTPRTMMDRYYGATKRQRLTDF